MTLETDATHVTALIPDYVLDLLEREEQRTVSLHLAECRHCQRAVRRERQIVFALRDTISTATQPDPKRLSALRPETPQRGPATLPLIHKPLAATLLLLLVILGSLALHGRRHQPIWSTTAPGIFAATASATNAATDTPTIAATSTATEMANAKPAQPTPQPASATASAAFLAPRPAVIPVAVSPFLRGYR
jgi:anti-sigma factor RsiW